MYLPSSVIVILPIRGDPPSTSKVTKPSLGTGEYDLPSSLNSIVPVIGVLAIVNDSSLKITTFSSADMVISPALTIDFVLNGNTLCSPV